MSFSGRVIMKTSAITGNWYTGVFPDDSDHLQE